MANGIQFKEWLYDFRINGVSGVKYYFTININGKSLIDECFDLSPEYSGKIGKEKELTELEKKAINEGREFLFNKFKI